MSPVQDLFAKYRPAVNSRLRHRLALLYSVAVITRVLPVFVLCSSLGLATTAQSVTPASSLTPDQLRPGQHAVVKTVFQGSQVEEFEAEIVGVLPGGRTGGDLILARATSERVVKSGVALGMSGSPVYVDGKLVGALSSTWGFSREPLFGITPIGEMLEVLDHPSRGAADATDGPTGVELGGTSTDVRFGAFRWAGYGSDTEDQTPGEAPAVLAPPAAPPASGSEAGGLSRLALPLSCSGLHPAAFDRVRQWLEPFGLAAVRGGASRSGGPAPKDLEPGSAVAIEVLRGDLMLSAIGTLTYRDGDRVLLFGHPLFQSGDIRLPLATAEITTIVASQQISFKLGVRSREAGVVDQDRRTAVAGHLGGAPRMLPLSVEITGAAPRAQRFRFESIEDRALAPVLISIATLNSLLESGGTGANQTLRWTLRLHRKGASPLTLSDVLVGNSPSADLVEGIRSPLDFLFNNPYDRLHLDSASVAVTVEPGREQWTLRGARVLDAAVRPGGRVRIEGEVERWRGERELREFSLHVPEEVPDGRHTLWLGGSAELARFEARHLPGRYRPTSLDDAWKRLSGMRSSDGLYAALFARAPELTSEGRDYPELPLSALSLLSNAQRAGDRIQRGDVAKLDEKRLPLEGAVSGELLIQVVVDSKAP